MKKCPNCGYEPSWLTGREIEEKYGITVINVPLDDLMSPICLCGHHAKYHKNQGTAGKCVICQPTLAHTLGVVHNFIPTEHTKQIRTPLLREKR
jgi:hypothetical protein